jgi:hypothetical protein
MPNCMMKMDQFFNIKLNTVFGFRVEYIKIYLQCYRIIKMYKIYILSLNGGHSVLCHVRFLRETM